MKRTQGRIVDHGDRIEIAGFLTIPDDTSDGAGPGYRLREAAELLLMEARRLEKPS